MQHHRGAHARAGVGGAGGQVAQLRIEAEGAYGLQPSLHAEGHVCRRLQIQAGADGLNAKMVLLIDHDAHAPVLPDQRGAGFRPLHKVAADQVLFHQLEPLDVGQIAHQVKIVVFLRAAERRLRPLDAQAGVFRPVLVEKGQIKVVSCKPYPAWKPPRLPPYRSWLCRPRFPRRAFSARHGILPHPRSFHLPRPHPFFWRSSLTRAARSSSGEGVKAAGRRPACCARPWMRCKRGLS